MTLSFILQLSRILGIVKGRSHRKLGEATGQESRGLPRRSVIWGFLEGLLSGFPSVFSSRLTVLSYRLGLPFSSLNSIQGVCVCMCVCWVVDFVSPAIC